MRNRLPSYLSVLLLKESDFYSARTENLSPLEYPEGIYETSDPNVPAMLETGCYNIFTSFDELLISANAEFEGKGNFTLEASINGGKWLSFGKFSTEEGESGSASGQKDSLFSVDTDVIKALNGKTDSCRLNIRLTINGKAKIKLISFTATDTDFANKLYVKYGGYYIPSHGTEDLSADNCRSLPVHAPTLPIPPLSQFTQPTERAARICSPTSCAMALRHAGIGTDPVKMERATHDNAADICGNWFLNTAGAGAAGAYAFVTRLNSIYEAAELLRAGIPIAASVKIPEGALPGFPLGKTAGHFILIKGITEKGDFVVNDPAAPADEKAEIIYPGKEFLDAWFGQKQGLCYIITKDLSPFFRAAPGMRIFDKPGNYDSLETEAHYGEPVQVIKTEKKWAYVCLPEQSDNDIASGTLIPYKGWAEIDSFDFALPMPHVSMIDKDWTGIERHSGNGYYPWNSAPICRGARLPFFIKDALPAEIVLPQEKIQGMDEKKLDGLRQQILENAKKYLGFQYKLGGRAASVIDFEKSGGIDCSGLAGMAYLLCGISLPRNAHGQWIASKAVEPEDLKPADLMFLSDSQNEKKIGHVMLYLGGGRLIEATITAGLVREISCEEKFGIPFNKLKNGILLPIGKKFYCGTVLN